MNLYLTTLIQIIIFILFLKLILSLIKKFKYLELLVVFIAIITVTYGEWLNLFKYKMAVYHGINGIPVYIVFGGALVAWLIFKTASILIDFIDLGCIFCNILIFLGISMFLPIIEIIGLKCGLWYWTRPYSIISLTWFIGVWKFYFLFIASPALIGIFIKTLNGYKKSCCIVKQ